jgi:hypothetical protein
LQLYLEIKGFAWDKTAVPASITILTGRDLVLAFALQTKSYEYHELSPANHVVGQTGGKVS